MEISNNFSQKFSHPSKPGISTVLNGWNSCRKDSFASFVERSSNPFEHQPHLLQSITNDLRFKHLPDLPRKVENQVNKKSAQLILMQRIRPAVREGMPTQMRNNLEHFMYGEVGAHRSSRPVCRVQNLEPRYIHKRNSLPSIYSFLCTL